MGEGSGGRPATLEAIEQAAGALGAGPLTKQGIAEHLRPLFTRTLASKHIYLATHALGRPLDAVEPDLREGLSLWEQALTAAWEPWLTEEARYRARLASLIGAREGARCVAPRISAGPALRTVLNMLPPQAHVLSTSGEFTSIAMLLAQYASLGRIQLTLVAPSAGRDMERFETEAICDKVRSHSARGHAVSLVVVSHVFFATGQLLPGLDELARACHDAGARLLVDSYHSLGAVPIDVAAIGCDYLIGGCYKYLRGGPGAAFLYLSPEVLAAGLRPVDTGWFALQAEWQTDDGPRLREGGDALLEGTPAVLTYYQARGGLAFTQAVGVERLRAYGLTQLQTLKAMLSEHGIASVGGDEQHGAFLAVDAGGESHAEHIVSALAEQGIIVNARGARVRVCPDCLTTDEELKKMADATARCTPMLAP